MKKILTIAVLAAVVASCTQSEVEDVKHSNEYIGIASATVNNMVLTRAGETNPLQWGTLGLFVTTDVPMLIGPYQSKSVVYFASYVLRILTNV